jgi:hypothetical protein
MLLALIGDPRDASARLRGYRIPPLIKYDTPELVMMRLPGPSLLLVPPEFTVPILTMDPSDVDTSTRTHTESGKFPARKYDFPVKGLKAG